MWLINLMFPKLTLMSYDLLLYCVYCHQDYYYKNQLCWMEPPNGPGCLSSHLTTFNFNGFEELEHEVIFIKYILKEARVLNTVTIRVSDLHSKESVLKKLSIFPRHSSTCILTVEIGSIEGMLQIFYPCSRPCLVEKVTLLISGC